MSLGPPCCPCVHPKTEPHPSMEYKRDLFFLLLIHLHPTGLRPFRTSPPPVQGRCPSTGAGGSAAGGYGQSRAASHLQCASEFILPDSGYASVKWKHTVVRKAMPAGTCLCPCRWALIIPQKGSKRRGIWSPTGETEARNHLPGRSPATFSSSTSFHQY